MRLFYSIGIGLYAFAVRLAAPFNTKARQLAAGWRQWRGKVPFNTLDGHKVAWFHASSLGEFEQARPVMESFRRQHQEYKVCLTFFSPSGYEIRKNYSGADIVCYLPPDTRRNAKAFIALIHPDVAFFVKYDFWFNYLEQLHSRQTPTFLFSAIFRPSQYFFRWYGRWFARQLHCYSHIFVQNAESATLLKSAGVDHVSLAGDTRFDRVVDIARSAKPIEPVERFLKACDCDNVLVAGSSWEPDERNIKGFLDKYHKPLALILAPHVIDDSHLRGIERLFGNDRCVRFSQIKESPSNDKCINKSILIIDNIGMLSSIYQYATVAYIGGGFGKGIHNILEATAYDIPVCFGPNYLKFKEACDMIACGGAKSYTTSDELTHILSSWIDDKSARDKAITMCHSVMEHEIGSTQKIMTKVEQLVCQ
ncbi:MAG: 3-deoxy-D-manno-octulosonic acid transferase [Bacteroidales bacterium]|nr:3-deoxy-D-manno-octulosonic acid transferase [Bacteroidales bacterium]